MNIQQHALLLNSRQYTFVLDQRGYAVPRSLVRIYGGNNVLVSIVKARHIWKCMMRKGAKHVALMSD